MPSSPRLLAIVAAVIGMLIGYAASRWPSVEAVDPEAPEVASRTPMAATGTSPGETEIAALRDALDEERGRVGALELEVELLRATLAKHSRAADEAPASAGETAEDRAGLVHATTTEPEQDWFDQAALRSRDIDANRAAWLEERFEELQMAELYLRDQATREGWRGTPRHRDELRKLQAETRESLTEEDYDLLLYAAGRNNRVLVKDLLKTSPAAAAGIEPGDVVLRYGDQKILAPRDLILGASNRDQRGTVAVDLWRDGTRVRVYLPPGPLGVRIEPVRRFPEETGS